MRLSLNWRVAALAGALLVGACSKEPAPTQEPAAAKPAQAPAPAAEPASEPEAQAEGSTEEPQAEAPAQDSAPPEFKLGQTHREVMSLFGDCAERRVFVPPGPGKLLVETYQAKDDENCRKRLGERQFMLRGGLLYRITPGLIPPEPPRKDVPEGM